MPRLSEANVPKSEVDQTLLETILEGTAAETGEQFFAALVFSLAKALHVDGAWVTEYLEGPKRLRAFSFWLHDHYVPDYEYEIQDSPCGAVIEQKCLIRYPENVSTRATRRALLRIARMELLIVIDARETASTSPPTLNGSWTSLPLNC